jgi:predicted transcriptional regulator of viral defense system
MFDPRMEALAATQHGLITRAQAIELGLSRSAIQHRTQRGQWRLVSRGIYRLMGALDTPHQRALAAVLASGEGAVISHRSAAALHELPGFPMEPMIVSVNRDGRRSLSGVRLEESLALLGHHVSIVDDIPCTRWRGLSLISAEMCTQAELSARSTLHSLGSSSRCLSSGGC